MAEQCVVMKCENKKCTHEFQDNRYGEGRRVFNQTLKKSGDKHYYRCTVCLHEQTEK